MVIGTAWIGAGLAIGAFFSLYMPNTRGKAVDITSHRKYWSNYSIGQQKLKKYIIICMLIILYLIMY